MIMFPGRGVYILFCDEFDQRTDNSHRKQLLSLANAPPLVNIAS